MISIKNEEELGLMRECGQITANVMEKVLTAAKPGVTKADLDKLADAEIKRLGGQPSFTTVQGYNWCTCITVNSEVVHGIPNDYVLKAGDLVSVDLGVVLAGLHTDCARTIFLGVPDGQIKKFLTVGQRALNVAIRVAKTGKYIGDISQALQKTIEGAGFSVVRALVGHGIGRQLHEEPQVPGFVTANSGPKLAVGMTLAIEAIYTAGKPDVTIKPDGWTIETCDGSLGGLFEDTVAVTKLGPVILTRKN